MKHIFTKYYQNTNSSTKTSLDLGRTIMELLGECALAQGQQDAEEFFTILTQLIDTPLPAKGSISVNKEDDNLTVTEAKDWPDQKILKQLLYKFPDKKLHVIYYLFGVINKEIIQEIKDAAEYALDSPFPEDEELFTNVYL